jgi:hypothetical protein
MRKGGGAATVTRVEAVQPRRSRTVTAIVLGLILFPLCAVPLYMLGHIADNYDSSGGVPLGLWVGGLLPPVVAGWLARSWAGWRWLPAVLLGIASWFVCGVVMMVAFVALFGPY